MSLNAAARVAARSITGALITLAVAVVPVQANVTPLDASIQ